MKRNINLFRGIEIENGIVKHPGPLAGPEHMAYHAGCQGRRGGSLPQVSEYGAAEGRGH